MSVTQENCSYPKLKALLIDFLDSIEDRLGYHLTIQPGPVIVLGWYAASVSFRFTLTSTSIVPKQDYTFYLGEDPYSDSGGIYKNIQRILLEYEDNASGLRLEFLKRKQANLEKTAKELFEDFKKTRNKAWELERRIGELKGRRV